MEREICISDGLLRELDAFSKMCIKKYGVSVWFAEILGRRWSYIAGIESLSPVPPIRIKISSNLGILIEADEEIPEIISEAKRIVFRYGQKKDGRAS